VIQYFWRSLAWALAASFLGWPALRADNLAVVWNDLALSAVRSANPPPPVAVRNLAMVHLAMRDAVASSKTGATLFLRSLTPPAEAFSPEAALSEAAYRSLVALFPLSAESLSTHHRAILAAIPATIEKTNGILWGSRLAAEYLQLRQFDGGGQSLAWATNTQPGFWQRTLPNYDKPLLPHWGRVRPLALPSVEAFRPPPPASLPSPEWAAEFNLLKQIGATNSATRTPEQREIALFWADGPKTETPPGHWNRIAQQVIRKKQYDLAASARLLAALNAAMADAAIVCWEAKFHYNYWRPITAIRAAETDGNPDTAPDPAWRPLIPTPPFPEYTSGHSTFSGAAAEILAQITGSDEFPFVTASDGLPGVVRRFRRFSDAAREAGLSRIYGGIHFPSGNEQGLASGRKVAQAVLSAFPE